MIRLLPALALSVLLSLPALAQPAGGPGGIPVTSEPARQGDLPVEVLANGTVVAESVATIRPRVDGQIQRVHVQEGQMVTPGQPLFTLDSRQNRALLAQQEAQLAAQRAQAQRAQLDAARYQSLRGDSFASQQRFEQAVADAAAAAAQVRATEALIQQTRLLIDFATIEAEVGGRLGALPLRAGNFVRQAENVSLGTITQVDPIMVQFAVAERWLDNIRAALARGPVPVTVRAEGMEGPPPEGEVVFVDSAVDVATGTIALKARFQNADERLWPGQYVNVTMIPRVERDAISIPVAAIQTGQQGRYVFVIQEGQARRRSVELVRTVRDRAVVRGQIAGGERVIVDGAQRVTDGSRVQDRTPPAAAPPAPAQISQR
ncbi:MAG: efflux RND transporter periplasmic adaptor subunit [Acetobacteraceae bacterium]|nr:efflux RND transporter periplasmic adaptor subunit [Acetobacteraceae bacterium]